ncbi:hypothetical protein BG28_06825 [Nesterenkonia sp. AN1]|uniref:hypothetical protein n=1 Tax=Nesterenkonia sp. AN1 TaxID=652017 RepID=UPI000446ABCC|nr:hypothetical protein [Nesterenkonia sp. AN1]EXF24386.1 hypothetical protein BG28_06825 [Nesterenkonia sp. AN1]
MMRARINFYTLIGLLSCGLLAMTSCTSGAGRDAHDHEPVDVGDYLAAAYISPQMQDLGSSSTGYVVLINKTGDVSTIETSGMDIAALAWSEQGLFFSDLNNDYLLGPEGLSTSTSPKTDYQHALFPTAEGAVGLFNEGFIDDGYVEQVVEFDGETSQRHDVEGLYLVAGMCDGVMYGIAEPTGPYIEEAAGRGIESDGEYGFNALMLTQLSATKDGKEELITIQEVPDSDQWHFDVPCEHGVLRHLATRHEEGTGERTAVLRRWDTSTGEFNEVELRHRDGAPVEMDEEYGFQAHGTAPMSAGRDGYQWVSVATNELMTTNTSTGETEPVVKLEGDHDLAATTFLTQFTDSHLFTLSFTIGDDAMVLHSCDRYTGDLETTLEVSELSKNLNKEDVLRGFAVPPR